MVNKQILVKINTGIYPLEAVFSACYAFINDFYIFLNSRKKGEIETIFKSKKKLPGQRLANLKDEFVNELLYNSIRITVAKRHKKLREMIVGRALFSAVEKSEEKNIEDADYINDPLGIAMPWEEKYQKNRKNKK